MMKRDAFDKEIITARNRIVIFYDTALSASKALLLPDSDINYDFMLSSGVKSKNLLAACITPTQLKSRGVDSAEKMKLLGFDALHLTNVSFCNQSLMAFGREELLKHLLVTAQDAVSLAGSAAVSVLNIHTEDLLKCTIGSPVHAHSVLKQMPRACSLQGVSADTILDCGLHLKTLSMCGYTLASLIQQTKISPSQLEKLGFVV